MSGDHTDPVPILGQAVIDALVEAIAQYSNDDKLVLWNCRFAQCHKPIKLRAGMSFSEVLRAMAPVRVAQGNATDVEQHIRCRTAFHANPVGHLERNLPDGRTFFLRETRLPDGGWLETFTEVTGQQLRERLDQTNELMHSVFDAIAAELIVYDPERRLALWNAQFEHSFVADTGAKPTLGMTMEAIVRARLVSQGITPDEIDKRTRERVDGYQSGESRYYTTGSGRVLRIRDTPVAGGSTVVTLVDVTDLKEAQRSAAEKTQALEKLNAELERSNAEFSAFAHLAAHDLKAPLRHITQFSNLLASNFSDALGERGKELIARMTNGAGRMNQLVDNLLEFARAGAQAQTQEPIDLNIIVEHVRKILAPDIRAAKATIDVAALPWILGDEPSVIQLVQNLVANAIKYHAPGASAHVHISAQIFSDHCKLQVQDNGIGIEAEYLDRIFEPLKRLHSYSEYPGTGLGLATCMKVAQRLGGRIDVTSEPGTGTTFTTTLPLAPNDST